MRIEPGIGWGTVKLGMTRRELVRALGQPSKSSVTEDCFYDLWESQSVRTTISVETQKLEEITLLAGAKLEGSDVEFGMDRDALVERLGESSSSNDGLFNFPGICVQLRGGKAVEFTVEHFEEDRFALEPQPTNAELEAAIAAQPDDASAYLVFGDWLTQQGHAHGALIAEAAAGTKVDKKSPQQLFGPTLARVADVITDRTWRFGVLEKVKVASNFDRSPNHNGQLDDVPLSKVIEFLFESVAGRFVRDLRIGISTFESNDYGLEMQAVGAKPRPFLRSLYVGDFEREETELNWSQLGDASVMWKALGNLRDLTLRSGSMSLGKIELPELRSFATRTGGLSKDNVKSIATAQWPKLESLDVQVGSDRYGSDVELSDLEMLLQNVPATVRHLGITNTEHADLLMPLIAQSPVLQQLETLDVSLGTLGPEGGQIFLSHADRFAHLKKIELSESWLGDDFVDRIREKLPQAVSTSQEEGEPDDRYIAAGE
ncbi:MAG: TIGR02996 domain-containing protein [Archangium sp.]